ncbi:hypothetical protein Halhy_2540 [Haliscomenobacter hydrossis DSM 1100]|uniref:Uncharacterized protein n=1 Tax=Haliscomenobacter hydrossis (strain ATCC 27775 / DSM 1100 / LMG 10767 / O) TaxID=760192 RepID=F4KYK7_HALH1|nr:hypothetical protein Halhy_2540 [Haliscomenobacter hydrossis DSM 1100]
MEFGLYLPISFNVLKAIIRYRRVVDMKGINWSNKLNKVKPFWE